MNDRKADPSRLPGYLTLQALAVYSSCSVRWLRARLTDKTAPLTHHRVEGKLLVKRDDFDQWMARFRVTRQPHELDQIVDGVLEQLCGQKTA